VNKAGVANPMQAAEQHYRRGRALFEENDFHTAAHMFREAIKLDDSWATYHFYLGKTLAILSQARQIHKHHDGCHVTCKLGGNLVRNSRIRHEAEQAMLKAAELDPSNPEILVKLGQLYKEAGMAKKAEQYFRDTLILDGRNRIALEELGIEED
jgi:Flp pilus assembly protein TadD